MKKIHGILLLTLATGMVAILSACGSEAPPPPPPPQAQPTAAQAAAESPPTEAPTAMIGSTTQPAAGPTDAPALEKPATDTSEPQGAAPTDAPSAAAAPTEIPAPTDATAPAATSAPAATAAAATDTPAPPTAAPTEPPTAMAPEPSAPEGTDVGETPPAFTMQLNDGTPVALADLKAAGRPAFMMYFATW